MERQIVESFLDELEKIALVGAVPKMAQPPRTAAPTPAPVARMAPMPAAKPPVAVGPSTGGAKAPAGKIQNPGPASPQALRVQPRAKTIVRPLARTVRPDMGGAVTKIPVRRVRALGF